jgi:hypothetical protein
VPVEPEIRRVIDANRAVFESLGCIVEEAEPDFAGVDEAFATLRHLSYHSSYAALARQKPEWVKDTIKWEIAEAERQSAADVAHAMERQSRMYADSARFFQRLRLLRASRDAGRAVRREHALSNVDQQRSDAHLHRLDALVLVCDAHGEPGDLGARRVHGRGITRGAAARRSPSRRMERAADGVRIRAGHRTREAAALRRRCLTNVLGEN